MRILHENSVILDFRFLQLHCFRKHIDGNKYKENREQKAAVHCVGVVEVVDGDGDGVGDVGVGVPCVTRCQWA